MFWNWIVVLVVQLCEYSVEHFKGMNFMGCELYLLKKWARLYTQSLVWLNDGGIMPLFLRGHCWAAGWWWLKTCPCLHGQPFSDSPESPSEVGIHTDGLI